jgi:plasmid segregation protein ParM
MSAFRHVAALERTPMNRQPKLLGLDLGFGFTKCVDGERAVIFQSRLCRGIEGGGAPAPVEGVFRIELEEGDFIVGDDASGTSLLAHFARRSDLLVKGYGKTLALTAAALFSQQECPLQIVIGLPVSQVAVWTASLVEQLTGYHKIGLCQADGNWSRKNVHIRKVHVVPHPLGSFSNLIMDQGGNLRPSDYRNRKVALVDIGFRTTDVAVMASGRFCNRGSGTIDMGFAEGLEAIARKLYRETGCIPDLDRLYRAVRMGFIRIEDQEYNLRRLREETYRHLAATLADRINYQLREDWDMESVLLTGGGATDLAEDLAPLLDGEVILIEHEQDVRLGNAQGNLYLARHLWGASGFCGNRR